MGRIIIIFCLLFTGCVAVEVRDIDPSHPVGLENDSEYEVLYQIDAEGEVMVAGKLLPGGRQLIQLPYGEYVVYVLYVEAGLTKKFETTIYPEDYVEEGIPNFMFSSPTEDGIQTYDL